MRTKGYQIKLIGFLLFISVVLLLQVADVAIHGFFNGLAFGGCCAILFMEVRFLIAIQKTIK
jgi:hypothetical protein